MTDLDLVSNQDAESLASRIDFSAISGSQFLISGASGMVGGYMASALLKCCSVLGLPSPKLTLLARSTSSRNLRQFAGNSAVTLVETAPNSWRVDKTYDVLIHAASPASPTQYGDAKAVVETNVGFLDNLKKQLMPESTLFISSGEVYGANPPLAVDEDFDRGVIPDSLRAVYPESKIAAEQLLWQMGEDGNTKPLVARLFHSFGPGLKDADGRSFGDFLWAAARGRNLELLSSGSAIRSFLYLEDAVAGLLTVITKGIPGQAYNVGSGDPVAICDFAELVGRVAGVEVRYAPSSVPTKGDYMHSPNQIVVPSNSKVSQLGWKQIIPVETGVRRTLDWIKRELEGST